MIIKASKKFRIGNIVSSAFLTFTFLMVFIFSMRVISFKTIIWLVLLFLSMLSLINTIKIVNECQIELKDDMIIIEQVAKKFKKSNFIKRFCQPYIAKYDAQRSVRDYIIILKRDEILYKDIIKCDYISKLRIKIEQAFGSDLGIIANKKYYISSFQFSKNDLELIRDRIHEKINDKEIN